MPNLLCFYDRHGFQDVHKPISAQLLPVAVPNRFSNDTERELGSRGEREERNLENNRQEAEWNRSQSENEPEWDFCSSVKKGFEFIWITDFICHQPIFISRLTAQHSVGITTSACVMQGSSQPNLYLSIPSTPLHTPSTIFNAFPVSQCHGSHIKKQTIRNAYLVPFVLRILTSDSSS